MHTIFDPLSREKALAVLSWRYDPPYDCYNFNGQNIAAELQYLTASESAFFSISNPFNELEGFCSFGKDGQVPGGSYQFQALDIGMGLRPDLTGQGQGRKYAEAVAQYAMALHHTDLLRVTIAAFNERAQKVWSHIGFEITSTFLKSNSESEFVVMTLNSDSGRPTHRIRK